MQDVGPSLRWHKRIVRGPNLGARLGNLPSAHCSVFEVGTVSTGPGCVGVQALRPDGYA